MQDAGTKLQQGSAQLRCIGCGSVLQSAGRNFRCPDCDDLLEVTYPGWKCGDTALRSQDLKASWSERRKSNAYADQSGVWRFRELLPVPSAPASLVSLCEGNTPVYELPNCARSTGVEALFGKHQGMNPTGSFKDTGMTVAATFARLAGFRWVACASTGNSSALGKACLEMRELGLISRLPKISIIQAEGANPLVRAMRENGGKKLSPMRADTMATAIRIGNPASWKKAVRVLEATGGTVEQVSEVEIALAKAEIGADGVGCEPASAVTLAGLKKLVKQGFIKRNESVVLILTGHMLKDPDFTIKFHRGDLFPDKKDDAAILKEQQRAPIVLDASVEAVLKALEQA